MHLLRVDSPATLQLPASILGFSFSIALLEQGRVVVRRRAVQQRDVGLRLSVVGEALDQAAALEPADRDVVKGHAICRGAGERQAVAVDRRNTLGPVSYTHLRAH